MAQIVWPTHRAKARKRENERLYKKKRRLKLRRLNQGGKRGGAQ